MGRGAQRSRQQRQQAGGGVLKDYSVQCPVWAAEGSKSPAAKKLTFKSCCWLVRLRPTGSLKRTGSVVSALWGCVQMASTSFRSRPYPIAYLHWRLTPELSFSSIPALGGLNLPCGKGNGGFQEPAAIFFFFF